MPPLVVCRKRMLLAVFLDSATSRNNQRMKDFLQISQTANCALRAEEVSHTFFVPVRAASTSHVHFSCDMDFLCRHC